MMKKIAALTAVAAAFVASAAIPGGAGAQTVASAVCVFDIDPTAGTPPVFDRGTILVVTENGTVAFSATITPPAPGDDCTTFIADLQTADDGATPPVPLNLEVELEPGGVDTSTTLPRVTVGVEAHLPEGDGDGD